MPFIFLVLVLLVVVYVLAVRGLRRRRQEKRRDELLALKCKCGYLLAGLELPRCPECGRMIGFDKTVEELGLSVAEMEAHVARKKAEREGMTKFE